MSETLLAVTLLAMPPGVPVPEIPADEWPAFQTAMQRVAIQQEILDPQETKHVLIRVNDTQADVDLLRKRYHDLKDAPRLSDCLRFPERTVVNDLLSFNRLFRQHLDARQVLEADRAACYRAAVSETDWLYQVWDAVRDARCELYYITVRRQALRKLRTLVGPEAFYTGTLPPHVPVWRFQELY